MAGRCRTTLVTDAINEVGRAVTRNIFGEAYRKAETGSLDIEHFLSTFTHFNLLKVSLSGCTEKLMLVHLSNIIE